MITDSKARVGPWAGSPEGKSREPSHHHHHHHLKHLDQREAEVQASEQSQLSEASQVAGGMPYPKEHIPCCTCPAHLPRGKALLKPGEVQTQCLCSQWPPGIKGGKGPSEFSNSE